MKPVLKWAGGKTQLLDSLKAKMPSTFGRYFEPFIGGGAFLLANAPVNAFINDVNAQLVNLYNQIKSNVPDVISFLADLDSQPCSKDFYYVVREKFNQKIADSVLDPECAALMIWINKHCFNGLYRVNNKGLFNVPYNNRVIGNSFDENNLTCISSYLQESNVTITCGDFEDACKEVKAGDFVYFDSPYVPVSATANFTDYTKDSFLYEDHLRLARLFKDLDKLGAKLLLSNNDVPLVHELYSAYRIDSIQVKRMINREASKRTGQEVIVTNY